MKKLFALARAFAIVGVALLPGFGAAFSMAAGAPREQPAPPPAVGRVDLVGSWVAMEPGMEEGALQLGFARTTTPLPAGASPALVLE
jgi:ABC-type sugar transport system substrate-binding protein